MIKTLSFSLLALATSAALAGEMAVLPDDEAALLAAEAKAAAGMAPKEINQSCGLVAPLPTTPSGPTWSAEVNDVFFGMQNAKFRMTAWRTACPDGDHQLMLTIEPGPGGTNLPDLFTVQQNGRNYNTFLVRDAAGAHAPPGITSKATYLLRFLGDQSATFDDDAALTITYLGLSTSGRARIEVPPAPTSTNPPPQPNVALSDLLDGAWFNPGHTSQGLLLDVARQDGVVSGAWFTADPQTGVREWFTFLGPIEGSAAQVEIYRTDGVRFLQNAPTTDVVVGQGTIRFTSCSEASFEFSLQTPSATGTIALTKLTRADASCGQ